MRLLLLALCLAACGGDPPSNNTQIDAPAGEACTGAAFDPCTDNSQCDSGNCRLFEMDGFQVCIETCTPNDNSTCPVDSSGNNARCNGMGNCKPVGPNSCTR